MKFSHTRFFFLSFLMLVNLVACVPKYEISEGQLEAYYQDKALKPSFHQIDTLGRSLHYAQIGHHTLPLLFFVHGAWGNWQGYFNLMNDAELQERFFMVSIDRPGYGNSNYGEPLVSIEDQARMMHAILARYPNNRPIILLGRSFGSPIVARLAMDYPELVDAMVMLAPPIDPKLEKFWWFSPVVKHPRVMKLMPEFINVATYEKYAHVRELRKMEKRWHKIHAPSTVIQGGNDKLVEPSNLIFAEEKLENAPARLVYIPDQNHNISTDRPDLVKKYILQHYREYMMEDYVSVARIEAIEEE